MRRLSLIAFTLGLAVSMLAAPAAFAKKAKASKAPAIKTVSPMRVTVGGTLTLRGRNFKPSTRKNTVVFRSPSGPSVLAKPSRASRKKLVVKVPAGVEDVLSVRDDAPVPTRFKIRVLAGKAGKYTSRGRSPVLVSANPAPRKPAPSKPKPPAKAPTPAAPPAPTSCRRGGDTDGDLLSDTLETTLKTNACKKDSDGDGVEDGFEYKSAVDLNDDEFQEPNQSLPYPGKKPYPNPLDGSDANLDFDGDALNSLEEQRLWKYVGGISLSPMSYSAGEQYSVSSRGPDGRRTPTLPAAGYAKQAAFLSWTTSAGYRQVVLSDGPPWFPWYDSSNHTSYGLLDFNRSGAESGAESGYYDSDGDGFMSDDERDEDADGLSNRIEARGEMMNAAWWNSCYADADEMPYPVVYAGTKFDDSDTDGDGVRDGADDQDHDDIPNLMELSRSAAGGVFDGSRGCKVAEPAPDVTARPGMFGRVQPFNPCLPNPRSRTCSNFPDFGTGFAPFDDSVNWYSLN